MTKKYNIQTNLINIGVKHRGQTSGSNLFINYLLHYNYPMARPLRIEYSNAFYHVMNRGAGYRDIFLRAEHREMFLELLREIHEMFRVEIHAYCLMDNHYHLLLSTPDANLSRAMRHLNGVYTQRFNRTEKTDGALFRGRFKAILVDADNYLLSVSKYIHRNPVEASLVKNPDNYPWSSYRQFVGSEFRQSWLNVSQTLGMIGARNIKNRYQAFVESGSDDEINEFYQNKRQSSMLGSDEFTNLIASSIQDDPEIPETKSLRRVVDMGFIVDIIAKVFSVKKNTILGSRRGRGQKNIARSASIYLCRKFAGYPLNEIAEYFNLHHYGSVSGSIKRFKFQLHDDLELENKLNQALKLINRSDL